MSDLTLQVAGDDSFDIGVNSSITPGRLAPGEYVMAMNIINRGGIAQTRPGSASLSFDIPGTNLQGITMFQPSNGPASLVFAVDGEVFYSPYPFKTYHQLPDIQFSPYTKYIAWAPSVQSTDYTSSGILINLPATKNILIMQDGATRAAYWDGSSSGHIDPTPSGQEFTVPGFDGTPVGLWMIWSNNRLWVSRGNMIFASDIGNPLKFTETQYLNEARAFFLSGECTGMAETADQQGLICFTPQTGVFIKSSVQDRTTWLSTPDFVQTILPSTGCVSPRSIVQQHGLIWWFTTKGLINLNDALRQHITSKLEVQDQQMAQSKANMSYDISGIAGGWYDNFLFHAIPNGDKINTRIHLLDQSPRNNQTENTWPSYWEGWRPVEFARGIILTQERVFCLSKDYDGINRIWELFTKEKTDNGIPITSYIQTRPHFFENRDYKVFRYAEVEMCNISGPTATMVAACGLRGGFQKVGTKDISAQIGQIYHDVQYGFSQNDLFGTRAQTRIVKSNDGSDPSECNNECIESTFTGLRDKCFSILIAWSGIAGVTAYRVFARPEPTDWRGLCEPNETDETRMLTPAGCGSTEILSSEQGFTNYYATATFTRIDPVSGLPITNTSTQASVINQEDATRKASQMAKWYVQRYLGEII